MDKRKNNQTKIKEIINACGKWNALTALTDNETADSGYSRVHHFHLLRNNNNNNNKMQEMK